MPGRAARRLRGEPGTPEFIASYNEAARPNAPPQWAAAQLLMKFQYTRILGFSPTHAADYVSKIKLIETEFGDFPLAALTDKRHARLFKDWRDELALKSRRQADYAWVVLARVLSWALDRGVDANPCERGGRLYRGSRADKIWTPTTRPPSSRGRRRIFICR